MPIVRIINPNSNTAVTDGMADAVAPLRMAGGPDLDSVTLMDGPFGIETDADVATAANLVTTYVNADDEAAAFVVACYSDPGLEASRNITDKPVFGIAECAALTALTRGRSFGVISILDASIPRHMRYLETLGLDGRCAGDRALNMSVAETAMGESTFDKMAAIGADLREKDGADVIILGCAGMARHRDGLEKRLGVPVIDPVQAAAVMALGAVQLTD